MQFFCLFMFTTFLTFAPSTFKNTTEQSLLCLEIIVDGKGHIIDDEGYVNVEAKHFSLSKLRAGSTATVTATLTQITTTTAVVRDGTNTVQYKEKSGFTR